MDARDTRRALLRPRIHHSPEASEHETGGSSGDHGSEEAESDSQEAGRVASPERSTVNRDHNQILVTTLSLLQDMRSREARSANSPGSPFRLTVETPEQAGRDSLSPALHTPLIRTISPLCLSMPVQSTAVGFPSQGTALSLRPPALSMAPIASQGDFMAAGKDERRLPVLPIDEAQAKSHTYLITGGANFMGRHLARRLLDKKYKVRILDMVDSPDADELGMSGGDVVFFKGDIRKYDDVRKACQGVDCVFHTEYFDDPFPNPHTFKAVKVRGTENVIRACVKEGVSQLIYTSHTSVITSGRGDIQNGDERLEYTDEPADVFTVDRIAAEKMVLRSDGRATEKGNGHRLRTCALRPHMIFGPLDHTRFIGHLIRKTRKGEVSHVVGEGDNIVDFTYIDNAVHAHVLASRHLVDDAACCGKVYFITNGEPTLFWGAIGKVLNKVGYNKPVKHLSFSVAYAFAWILEVLYYTVGWIFGWKPMITRQVVSRMTCHCWFNHDAASRDLGYYPQVTLEAGIQATVDYFRKQKS